jgi:hypothetical protein
MLRADSISRQLSVVSKKLGAGSMEHREKKGVGKDKRSDVGDQRSDKGEKNISQSRRDHREGI